MRGWGLMWWQRWSVDLRAAEPPGDLTWQAPGVRRSSLWEFPSWCERLQREQAPSRLAVSSPKPWWTWTWPCAWEGWKLASQRVGRPGRKGTPGWGDAARVPPGCLGPSVSSPDTSPFPHASGSRDELTQQLSTEGDSWGSRPPCAPSISLLLLSPQCSSILQKRVTCSSDLEGLWPSGIPLPQRSPRQGKSWKTLWLSLGE